MFQKDNKNQNRTAGTVLYGSNEELCGYNTIYLKY